MLVDRGWTRATSITMPIDSASCTSKRIRFLDADNPDYTLSVIANVSVVNQ